MKKWMWWMVLGTAIGLTGLLAAYRLANCPGAREPLNPQGSLPDLAHRLRQRRPDWRVVPARPDGESCGGAYLCESPRDPQELRLPRNPSAAAKWAGVVFVERNAGPPPLDSDEWGENGFRAGPFLFFGDAKMIDRIREALR